MFSKNKDIFKNVNLIQKSLKLKQSILADEQTEDAEARH